jgi:hypothetical protein
MHRTVLRMISSGSLAAFSASALEGVSGIGAGIAQKVQVTAEAASGASAPRSPDKPGAPMPMPSKILPRGSLLDLSV